MPVDRIEQWVQAALKALEILDSAEGRRLILRLKELTGYFKRKLDEMGYEVINGKHPITAVMIRNRQKTARLVDFLKENGVLAVGLKYPVVPAGDECLRFQVGACHTREDLDYVLGVMSRFSKN